MLELVLTEGQPGWAHKIEEVRLKIPNSRICTLIQMLPTPRLLATDWRQYPNSTNICAASFTSSESFSNSNRLLKKTRRKERKKTRKNRTKRRQKMRTQVCHKKYKLGNNYFESDSTSARRYIPLRFSPMDYKSFFSGTQEKRVTGARLDVVNYESTHGSWLNEASTNAQASHRRR